MNRARSSRGAAALVGWSLLVAALAAGCTLSHSALAGDGAASPDVVEAAARDVVDAAPPLDVVDDLAMDEGDAEDVPADDVVEGAGDAVVESPDSVESPDVVDAVDVADDAVDVPEAVDVPAAPDVVTTGDRGEACNGDSSCNGGQGHCADVGGSVTICGDCGDYGQQCCHGGTCAHGTPTTFGWGLMGATCSCVDGTRAAGMPGAHCGSLSACPHGFDCSNILAPGSAYCVQCGTRGDRCCTFGGCDMGSCSTVDGTQPRCR